MSDNYVELIEAGQEMDAEFGEVQPLGVPGKSAYEVAVDNGFKGTEKEWLETLKGNAGNAIGADTHAEGFDTIAGMKGYYYSSMELIEGDPVSAKFILTDKQKKTNPVVTCGYAVGDVVSLVNGSKYMNCATITEISGNKVTVSPAPFETIKDASSPAVDDYSFYCLAKPTIGVVTLGSYAHAEGEGSQALERSSHAEGRQAKAYGQYSHAEGRNTEAWYCAHAEGKDTRATGDYAHAEGCNTIASGDMAHTEGQGTVATGYRAHAEGHGTVATGNSSHVQGRYNIIDSGKKYAHIIGNGDGPSDEERSNAHTVDWKGNAWFAGTVECAAPTAANHATTKKYVDDAIKNAIANLPVYNGEVL